jgi:hypothetical protein
VAGVNAETAAAFDDLHAAIDRWVHALDPLEHHVRELRRQARVRAWQHFIYRARMRASARPRPA